MCLSVTAQDSDAKSSSPKASPQLKITGYLQPEWQIGEQAASLTVGQSNQIEDQCQLFNRFGFRRGRIKFTYEDAGLGEAVLQFNVIEKPGLKGAQVQIKDLYFKLKAPWNKSSALQAGVFGRPFGFELNRSSSQRESPERAEVIASLFPGRSDLGAMITLNAGEHSPLHFLTFKGGLFAGNGIHPETDNRKDFIGQLIAVKSLGTKIRMGIGMSYYNGGVFQTNDTVFTMNDGTFSLDVGTANRGSYAKREYVGFDAQLKYQSTFGVTQLTGEYIVGTQPGTATTTNSPNRALLPSHQDTYIRPFAGGYVMLVQGIGNLPFSAILKFESLDPNSAVAGNNIGTIGSFTSEADVQYHTLGIGANWQITPYVLATLYYDRVINETSTLLSAADYQNEYTSDRKDNKLTLRVQYKF